MKHPGKESALGAVHKLCWQDFSFSWPPTPLRWHFHALTKSGHFWTTYLPCLVSVVCERPLMKPNSSCLTSLKSLQPSWNYLFCFNTLKFLILYHSKYISYMGGFFANNVVCQRNHFCKSYNKSKCYEKSQIFNLW